MARLPGTNQGNKCALILGAGGRAASAWEIGLADGSEDRSVCVRKADLYVGTSAGARVAVQLGSGLALVILPDVVNNSHAGQGIDSL